MRLDRARKHLADFGTVSESYRESDPCRCRRVLCEGGAKHIYQVESLEPPLNDIGGILADIIQNCAAVLDYLIYELSRPNFASLRERDIREIQFPIYRDPQRFADNRTRRIGSIPSSAQATVERLQPFEPSNPHRVDMQNLYDLNIIYKHRSVGYGAARSDVLTHALPPDVPQPSVEFYAGILYEDAIVACYTFPEPYPDVDMGFNARIGIAFREQPGRGRFVWPVMNQIVLCAQYAVDQLRSEFA